MIGLRRQVRASVATVLAGTASVLQMAAGVAETVAQELRLTLDTRDGDASQDGGAAPTSGRRAASAPSAGRSLSDVTGRAEPRRLTAVDGGGGGRTTSWEEPPFAPGGGTDVGAAEGEAVPPPRNGRGAGGNGHAAAVGGGTAGTTDEPPPWVDDVAASVAGGTVREAAARLPELTPTQLRAVERHERSHAGRVTLLRAIDAELALRGE